MSHRCFGSIPTLVGVIAILLLATVPLVGQSATTSTKSADVGKKAAAAEPWTHPKTPWGDPDLQGTYTFATRTRMERPDNFGAKQVLTQAELAELEGQDAQATANEDRSVDPGSVGSYNRFWASNERGRRTGRTSLIVDPPDGRRPPLTPRAAKLRAAILADEAARRIGTPPNEMVLYNWTTDLPQDTRCVARRMPRFGQGYNHGIQILQIPGYVVIHYESFHDTRIIPLDGRPHLNENLRLWNGDERGRWEGNTLVVDWTNFTDRQTFQGFPQGNVRITERLTRVDMNTIIEEVTVEDPTTWESPWSYVLPWRTDDPNYQNADDFYEFACHEGNYRQMENALGGSRALEKTAAVRASSSK